MGMRGYREAEASIALEAAPHFIKQGTQEVHKTRADYV